MNSHLDKNLKFSPQDFATERTARYRMRGYGMVRSPSYTMYNGMGYSWHERRGRTDPWLENFFGHLHYKISHAPYVQARWKQAAVRWRKRTYWYKARINDRI